MNLRNAAASETACSENCGMQKNTKGIIVYLLIAFGLAWILWEIPLRMGISVRNPMFQLAALPGGFAPAIAAVVVRRWVTREGFSDAGLNLNLRKWPYYLAAWLLPLAVVAAITLLAAVFGIGHPDLSFHAGLRALAPQAQIPPGLSDKLWLIIPLQLLFTSLLATPLLWGEEFGWRSYLQIRLFKKQPVMAAVATGIIWGIWHYPLNLRGYNFPEHRILGLLLFPVSAILLSIIFGWLRLRSGSIWTSSLAHAATNSVGGSLTILIFAGSAEMLWTGYVGLLGWIPLGALCAWIILTGRLKPENYQANGLVKTGTK